VLEWNGSDDELAPIDAGDDTSGQQG